MQGDRFTVDLILTPCPKWSHRDRHVAVAPSDIGPHKSRGFPAPSPGDKPLPFDKQTQIHRVNGCQVTDVNRESDFSSICSGSTVCFLRICRSFVRVVVRLLETVCKQTRCSPSYSFLFRSPLQILFQLCSGYGKYFRFKSRVSFLLFDFAARSVSVTLPPRFPWTCCCCCSWRNSASGLERSDRFPYQACKAWCIDAVWRDVAQHRPPTPERAAPCATSPRRGVKSP